MPEMEIVEIEIRNSKDTLLYMSSKISKQETNYLL